MLAIVELIILVVVLVLIASFTNRNRSPGASRTPALLVMLGLLLPLVLATVFYVRMSRSASGTSDSISVGEFGHPGTSKWRAQPLHAALPAADTGAIEHGPPSEAAIWANFDEQPFDANIYPSQTAAAKPMAKKIMAALNENRLFDAFGAETEQPSGNGDSPVSEASATKVSAAELPFAGLTAPAFFLVHDGSPGKKTLARFSEELRAEFPLSELRVSQQDLTSPQASATVAADAVRLVVRAIGEKIAADEPEQPLNSVPGQLLCDIVTSKGSATVSADYIEKPWVEEFGLFVMARPQQQFVVGYSTQLASSAEEAGRLALQDAQNKVRITVEAGLSVTADASHIVDRFSQKLSRPYGDVWREAVLLDVSRPRLQRVIMAAEQRSQMQRTEYFSLAAALASLFGITVAMCFGLNFLTQGYYRNRLWTAVVVVIGIGLLTTLVRFVRMA